MAAASMKRAGKVRLMAARLSVTVPSSSGWRSTSSTLRRNSGSSSRKSTPPWARLTSPGPRDGAAADESGVADGVVRCAEGPDGAERLAPAEQAGDAVDLGGLERLVERHGRQDGGEPAGQHGLARARRADAAGCCARRRRPPRAPAWRRPGPDVGEVHVVRRCRSAMSAWPGPPGRWARRRSPARWAQTSISVAGAAHLEPLDDRRLGQVVQRQEEARSTRRPAARAIERAPRTGRRSPSRPTSPTTI